MASGGVTNFYLHNTLSNSLKCSHLFVGVFSSNNLNVQELRKKEEFILICNLSPQEQAGSHFVTIVANKKNIFYCDSLSLPINTSETLFASLKDIGRKITSLLTHPIQAPMSEFCGIFCIYFVVLFDHKRFPIVHGQRKFLKNKLIENDFICVENLKKLISENK